MKKLLFLSVLFIFYQAFLTNCGLSTNPEDNGLPTMEEVIENSQKNIIKYYAPNIKIKVLHFYREEKQFFYKNVNSIYLNNQNDSGYDLDATLEKNMGEKYTETMDKFSLKYFNKKFDNYKNNMVRKAICDYYLSLLQLMSEKESSN